MTARNDATEQQVRAARPDVSTWLAANAGSGKTRVLTDRVARLLLDKVQPQHILCLTYTKAAAGEMQNRLFRRLGKWAMLQDDDLCRELLDLGLEGAIGTDQLRDARTLFARAIETPGGLKIQTIHSFCSSLLRRFPLEAQVSPQFSEIEDRAATLLRAEIVDDMADGVDAAAVAGVARHYTGEDFDQLTNEIVRNRDLFKTELSFDDALGLFDLPATTDEEQITQSVFLGDEQAILFELIPRLGASGPMDQKAGQRLGAISALNWLSLPVLEAVFLTGGSAKSPFSAKLGSFPSKAVQSVLSELMPQLEDWMLRVEAARDSRLALVAARKTHALHQFACQFLPAYAAQKQQRGLLDFDDLIHKARHLLNDPAVAQWVLYRLDGGIDHILVDEAQDTSPAQWDVIEKLAQEFTSGQGARTDIPRTIFVVGDKKQSIYSFQGADPREFDRMQQEFKTRLNAVGQPLQDLTLEYSFRSADAILRLVDLTFETQAAAGFAAESQHRAFKLDLPGRVDLWPLVDRVDDTDDREWFDPVDQRSAQHHTVILANQIARNIRKMIDAGETIPVDGPAENSFRKRAVQEGDFLILLQRRSDLFREIIRACKGENLKIAGADRLKVGAETAVKDLGALLAFLATPEESLALAVALKSPLFGWSEQDLFSLSHHRSGPYLWQALRDQDSAHPETLSILNDLRGQTDFLRPFDLIERILTRHKGRKNLLSRLGREAEDGINALLSQALAYERSTVPSLTGFLIWMQTDDLDIKRQMDSAGNQIRVMTVHGAKGLEAPIVILPDTGKRVVRLMDEVMETDGNALWRTSADASPAAITAAREAQRQAQINERLRLLYVAMTRAEKWLIVAAAGELSNDASDWYQLVQSGMERAGALPHGFDGSQGLRLSGGDWQGLETVIVESAVLERVTVPEFYYHRAPASEALKKTLSPSDLGGAKALPGEAGLEEEEAKRRGRQVHLLLEHLANTAQSDWPMCASQILSQGADMASESEITELLKEARSVLTHPDLAGLFTNAALAEVSVTADLGQQRLHGTIDRLIINSTDILAVDFKTNVVVPNTPEAVPDGLLRQMGAYACALAQIYPHHSINTAIVWTTTGALMHLPHDLVTNALNRTPYLDDSPDRS